MDSQNENNFTISSQETLLLHHNNQQPKQTGNKNLKNILFITILILIILTLTTLFSISKPKKPKSVDLYLSRSSQYYCHLAFYPESCYNSMTSTINSTVLQTNPTPIFSTAIQVVINQLNNITFSKTYDSLVNQPRSSKCRTWVHDSLSRLNESLCIIDSDIESLTYDEMDNMKAWILNAVSNASECLSALEKIDAMVMDGEEKMGVEEVKMGVEKAMEFMVNSVGLLSGRESILNDFYNHFIDYNDDYYYDFIFYHQFDYGFVVFLYCGLYLFLGLLYFLFWWSR